MPLKLTKRAGAATWQIVGTVAGQRVRQSAGTADRRLAEEARAALEARLYRGAVYGERTVVTWSQAALSYSQVEQPSPTTARYLLRLSDHLGDTLLKDIDQAALDRACAALVRPDAAPATRLRAVITPLQAVLNHAARRGWCDRPMFEKPKGAGGVKRTRWLTPEEYTALREAAAPHLRPLVIFLAGTGARLSEALGLQWADVNLRLGTALLRDTKNGRDRQVELLPAVVAAMASITYPVRQEDRTLVEVAERTGSVFRTSAGRPYAETGGLWGGQIATAWAGACRRARLPGSWREGKPRRIQERLVVKGKVVTRIKEVRDRWWQPDDVSPHTLRHTWATWHYAVHRDLLRLKHEGDWSSVGLVERYAKLAPSAAVPAILVSWGAASADAANLGQLRSAI